MTTVSVNTAENKQFWAKWTEDQYSIHYHLENGQWNGNAGKQTRYFTERYELPTNVVRTGYTFGGWYYIHTDNQNNKTNVDISVIEANDDTAYHIYAKWTENQYNIVLVTNGGTYANGYSPKTSRKYTEGWTLPTSANITKTGYTFDGWYTNDQFTGSKVTSIAANTTEDKTFYLKWNINTYAVTFVVNNGITGATTISTQNIEYNGNVTKPSDPSAPNYKFMGWYQEATCVNPFDFNIAITQPTYIYAKWEQVKTWTVSFSTTKNVQSVLPEKQFVPENQQATRPQDPTAKGYDFDDWYQEAECINKFDFSVIIAANTIVYAKWIEKSYTITYDLNGGSWDGQAGKTSRKYTEAYTLPTNLTRVGYTFAGWYTDPDGGSPEGSLPGEKGAHRARPSPGRSGGDPAPTSLPRRRA